MKGIDIFGQKVRETNRVINHLPIAYVRERIIFSDKGKPVDLLIIDLNQAFEKITGFSREKLIGKRISEYFP